MEKIFVPPIKIQGIKTKLVPYIKENIIIDDDTLWIEPFMGSGVVGFNVRPNNAIFCDTNPHIINFYNGLKQKSFTSATVREFLEKEGEQLAINDDQHYYKVRKRFNHDHQPLDFLFLNRACFNGMIRFNRNGEFNVPYGHKPNRFSKSYITKIVNQVKYVESMLNLYDWNFICISFEEAIRFYSTTNSFIYCDPPYIGRHVDYYDSWSEEDEILLNKTLNHSKTHFMLSTWSHNKYRHNPYLDTIWESCDKINITHFYHIGAKESNRNEMVESLLTNYSIVDSKQILAAVSST